MSRKRKQRKHSTLSNMWLICLMFIATASTYKFIYYISEKNVLQIDEYSVIEESGNTEYISSLETSVINDDFVSCNEVYIEYIDVGQGDSTLILDKTTGFSCLIDTGLYETYDNVQEALSEYGIDEISVLVLTHPDTDHIQSAVDVIEDYNVPVVYMSKAQNNNAKTYEFLMEYLSSYNGKVIYPQAGDVIYSSENEKLTVLAPVTYKDLNDTNGNSLVMRLDNGNDSFLFLGDATGEEMDDIMAAGYDLEADVFKASHHGSANDGCNNENLFCAVDPEFAVVSCGYQNDYGHPHIETMELIQKYGIKLYRTDLQGSLSAFSNGNGIIWNQEPTTVYTNGNGF